MQDISNKSLCIKELFSSILSASKISGIIHFVQIEIGIEELVFRDILIIFDQILPKTNSRLLINLFSFIFNI